MNPLPEPRRPSGRRGEPHPGALHLLSAQCGTPAERRSGRQVVRTSIFKSPGGRRSYASAIQSGRRPAGRSLSPRRARTRRSTCTVRALCVLARGPRRARLRAFGANLTRRGSPRTRCASADRLRVGTAELVVTQPRLPCFKLQHALRQAGHPVKLFLESGRDGILPVGGREGEVRPVTRSRSPSGWPSRSPSPRS